MRFEVVVSSSFCGNESCPVIQLSIFFLLLLRLVHLSSQRWKKIVVDQTEWVEAYQNCYLLTFIPKWNLSYHCYLLGFFFRSQWNCENVHQIRKSVQEKKNYLPHITWSSTSTLMSKSSQLKLKAKEGQQQRKKKNKNYGKRRKKQKR